MIKLCLKRQSIDSTNHTMAIHELVQNNDVETIRSLIATDKNLINEKTGDLQNTPLHTAARKGSTDIAKLLIHCGAKLDSINKKHLTPIQIAASYGRNEILSLMIQQMPSLLNKVDKDGNSLSMLATSNRGHYETVQLLISLHADVTIRNKEGNTIYHIAAQRQRSKVLELLIKKYGNEHLNDQNRKLQTPLHFASMKGYDGIMKTLLMAGANQKVRDIQGRIPFELADRKSKIIFHCYSHFKHIELSCYSGMASLLATKYFEENCTAIHVAAMFPHTRSIIKRLVEGGVNIRRYDDNGKMPLHVAVEAGYIDNISAILHLGGSVNDVMKQTGNTALHLACHSNNLDIVKLLLRSHADISKKNKDGLTPLTVAIKHHALTVAEYILSNDENFELKDEDENSLLHYCVIANSPSISETLLKRNKDLLTSVNKDGETPLMMAARRRNSTLVTMFIEYGADAHWKNDTGYSAYSIASKDSDSKILKLIDSSNVAKS